MSVLTHFPKNRLAELTGRFGGLKKEEAVAAATRELDVLRPEADKAILASVVQLEEIVEGAWRRRDFSPKLINTLLPPADQIVTLSGTYGYTAMDKAARSLCDLLDGMLRENRNELASVRVHVQTMRMITPGHVLPPEHVEVLLFELGKVLDHHGIVPPADQGGEDATIGAAP
jgi:hypothetical protein